MFTHVHAELVAVKFHDTTEHERTQVRRYSWPRLLLVVPEIVLSTALSIVVENCAVFAMWFGRWDQVGRLDLVLCDLANGFQLSILNTRL